MRYVRRWDDSRLGPLCLDAVRAIHQPPEQFRISPYRYDAGVAFPGAARAGHRYLLAGACAFTFGAETWELRAGDIAELPEGSYQFRVLGAQPVEFVAVWELPPEVWSRPSATESGL